MSFDFGSPQEADPTADFLAREKLAAGVLSGDAHLFGSVDGQDVSSKQPQSLSDDFERSASSFPALDADGQPQDAAPSRNNYDGLVPSFDDGAPASAPSFSIQQDEQTDNELGQFEKSFPEIQGSSNLADHGTNGYMPPPASSQTRVASQPGTPYGGSGVFEQEEEPEAIRQWRSSQKDQIAKRDAEAERKKGEAISKAEQDIDKFYADYNSKKEKSISKNKEAEAKFHEERTRDLAEGTTWSRVTKILDLQNSQSKTIARSGPGSSDLSRMREIYLSLRREGESAPGAGGY
ncbi:hypothetical protein IE53DRAFT_384479 [Violaceomyces palustris]|uniref:Uncharacterized protein n=1 Tax=Violaceomyces palustris TaxID=1673888 RepID=A0ACD0P4N9_9BASI|nr:hypothetical protein IE53DRAFT_384479 [Violaceomyces palustris]